jgi:hypothetical protein
LTDKAITLSSGEIVSIKDTITIPSFINGNYLLSVVSRNKNGLFLASRDAGVISLNGSGESVFINPNSCTLTSNDSTPNSSLLSRIKVEKGDVITLTCSTENQGLQSISVIPHVETFSGSVFGEGKTTEQLLGNSITLLGGYKKTSSIKIKAEGNPHDYTAVVSFVSGGKKISNSINVNYKILGEQAKIMNIILDKDSYKKEDIANISILWKSDIEDLKSKLYLNLLIKNSESENCIEPIIRKPISNTKSLEIVLDVPIINDCLNPEVSVQIIDDNGYVMDESSFLMESNLSNKSISIYLYASVVVLILLIFGFVFVKRKNNGPNNIDNINVQ